MVCEQNKQNYDGDRHAQNVQDDGTHVFLLRLRRSTWIAIVRETNGRGLKASKRRRSQWCPGG